MSATRLALRDADFQELSELIRARSGIEVRPSHRFPLEARLTHRLRELHFDSFGQYMRFLTTGPFQSDEFHQLLSSSLIADGCFFRQHRQLEHFRLTILPGLLRARGAQRHLRIWNPACSTGEETYSIAIIVHRALAGALADWRVEILGTDISPCALDVARRAVYRRFSLPSVEVEVRRRYFSLRDGLFHVDAEVRTMVGFRTHNLTDDLLARRFGRWDAIFCRDALSRFNPGTRAEILATLDDRLHDDGVLLLGHDERVRDPSHRLVPRDPLTPGVLVKADAEVSRNA